MKKRICFLMAVTIIGSIFTGCEHKQKNRELKQTGVTSDEKNIVKEDSDSEDGGSSSEQAKSDELDLEPVIDANPVEDSCIYKMGDHVEWTSYMDEYSQLDFCLEDVKLTTSYLAKEYGGNTQETVERYTKADEKGNLLSEDYYYLWMNVKVKNNGSNSFDLVFDTYRIGMIDEEKYLYALETATQPVYVNKIIALDNTDKEAAFETLQSGEEKVYQIAYLLEKSVVERELIYYIGEESMVTPTNMARVIRLDKVVKE